ncbi:Werner Syndrome-like exonuclease [Hirschfeldia incana]|nr:Werner Syndrome-like exonuclease [Hirschfeldia incana]
MSQSWGEEEFTEEDLLAIEAIEASHLSQSSSSSSSSSIVRPATTSNTPNQIRRRQLPRSITSPTPSKHFPLSRCRGVIPGKVAVVQICVDNKYCDVMQIIHSGIPQSLQHLIEDSTLVKVGVGIDGDSVKLFHDHGVSIKDVEDLSDLANRKIGGVSKKWGLATLTETLVCKELLKPNRIRLGNWEARPLSKEQLQYAATDAYASWHLYNVLKDLPDAVD